jgi:hypothetical protein
MLTIDSPTHLDQPTSHRPTQGRALDRSPRVPTWDGACTPHVGPTPPVQVVPRLSRCGPDRANGPHTPTAPCDSVILAFRSAILIKRQPFFSFSQSFCYIVAIVLNHSCYSTQSFLLQCSAILENSFIPRCHSALPFFIEQ